MWHRRFWGVYQRSGRAQRIFAFLRVHMHGKTCGSGLKGWIQPALRLDSGSGRRPTMLATFLHRQNILFEKSVVHGEHIEQFGVLQAGRPFRVFSSPIFSSLTSTIGSFILRPGMDAWVSWRTSQSFLWNSETPHFFRNFLCLYADPNFPDSCTRCGFGYECP
jgi:hypothetical protein